VTESELVPLERTRATSLPSSARWLAGVEVRWMYETPQGPVFVGVGPRSGEPHDADTMVHVAGPGVLESWLPLGPHQRVSGGRLLAKRRVLHAGASGQVGSSPLYVHQSRAAGWALSRKRRAINVKFGDVLLKLTLTADSTAVLAGPAVHARFRVQAGLTDEPPSRDVSNRPLIRCHSGATPDEIALFVLIAECELPEEASHPAMILLDIGI